VGIFTGSTCIQQVLMLQLEEHWCGHLCSGRSLSPLPWAMEMFPRPHLVSEHTRSHCLGGHHTGFQNFSQCAPCLLSSSLPLPWFLGVLKPSSPAPWRFPTGFWSSHFSSIRQSNWRSFLWAEEDKKERCWEINVPVMNGLPFGLKSVCH
jgi:hypothetical protein